MAVCKRTHQAGLVCAKIGRFFRSNLLLITRNPHAGFWARSLLIEFALDWRRQRSVWDPTRTKCDPKECSTCSLDYFCSTRIDSAWRRISGECQIFAREQSICLSVSDGRLRAHYIVHSLSLSLLLLLERATFSSASSAIKTPFTHTQSIKRIKQTNNWTNTWKIICQLPQIGAPFSAPLEIRFGGFHRPAWNCSLFMLNFEELSDWVKWSFSCSSCCCCCSPCSLKLFPIVLNATSCPAYSQQSVRFALNLPANTATKWIWLV